MTNYQGAVDNRTKEEKSKDFQWDEFFASGSVIFPERPSIGYTVRNQDGSSSCVAQTVAKMLEVWDFKHDGVATIYSATPIYASRSNKPDLGMNFVDAFSHPIKKGTWLEKDIPSQSMGEDEMNNFLIPQPPQIERPLTYLKMPIDFYAVASEIDRSGAVMLWFKCSTQEWTRDIPVGSSDSEAIRHSVTAIDKIIWKETEYIIISDSWGMWVTTEGIPIKAGQRAISKKFFDKHCYFAGCFTSFTFDGVVKPQYTFTKVMRYGDQSEDVKALQNVLKYEKYFPSNQESTGYFGSTTARALIKWQLVHSLLDFQYESNMKKVQAGKKTISILNVLYGG